MATSLFLPGAESLRACVGALADADSSFELLVPLLWAPAEGARRILEADDARYADVAVLFAYNLSHQGSPSTAAVGVELELGCSGI